MTIKNQRVKTKTNPDTQKAAAAIFPARVFSPPGRLTSEFGMGSGVSAWPSQPPIGSVPCSPETECHSPYSLSLNRNSATFRTRPVPFRGKTESLGLLVRPGSAARAACTGRPSNHSLGGALTPFGGRPSLGMGFALRCSQRLSLPGAAFRRCRWRDNRTTVAPFPLVLAY